MVTTSTPRRQAALWRRLVWFVAIWAGSVLSLGVFASILKIWLRSS
jgi:hypothetical protein